MIIEERGKYRLLENFAIRTSYSITNLPIGTIIEITRVDTRYHKVTGDQLRDWIPWDMPVEKL